MSLVRAVQSLCPGLAYGHKVFNGSAVTVPVGSFEDHGPFTPSLDTLLAFDASCMASRLCSVLVAWPIGYGFSPEHTWSVSLDEDGVARLVARIVESLKRRGARRVIVVDGHYGHREVLARILGGSYINVWDILVEEGLDSFDKQLEFEAMLIRGGGERYIRAVASRICQMV